VKNPEGAWIFLSHSSKDWNEVRRIRNFLEEKGHRPLVFFLKCLTDHSELDGLIKREIEARTWFLLCDSQNARESGWVQAEVEFIKQLEGKYHQTIDLNGAIETQLEQIEHLCRRATVFISRSARDLSFAVRMEDALTKHDYSVWFDREAIQAGDMWMQEITRRIDGALARGFVLLLLSPNSVQSEWVRHEIEYALSNRKAPNVIPIMIDDPAQIRNAMPKSMLDLLTDILYFDFSEGDFDTNMDRLIADMKRLPMD
jgi:TIR domain